MLREKKRKNNKGFSLVELIIVIAIMAILVAILAPQFLKYVENSRNTADIANAREITNAVIAYIADSETETGAFLSTAVTIDVERKQTKISGDDGTVLKALQEAGVTKATDAANIKDIKCKSKTAWTSYSVKVNVDKDGVIIFEYEAKGGTDAGREKFKDAFQQGKTSGESGSGG